MAELFSEEWMNNFKEAWNSEPDLADALSKINFESVIGYGFDGEQNPRGVIKVEGGRAVAAGAYNGEELNWDLRASEENWKNLSVLDLIVYCRRLNIKKKKRRCIL